MKKGKIMSILIIAIISILFATMLAVGCSSKYNFDKNTPFDINQTVRLEKEAGKDFVILQIADTQIGTINDEELQKSFNQIKALVDEAKPDLIVMTGDNAEGKKSKKVTEKLVAFLDTLNIKYAPVFGNHDKEGGSLDSLAEIYMNGKNCLFKKGPENIHGVGNYVVNVIENEHIVYSFYMIDSNAYRNYSKAEKEANPLGGTNYDYIYKDQIDWYEHNVKGINAHAGKDINSLAFFHIAIPEFRYFTTEKAIIGEKREDVCNPYINTGFFERVKALNSTKGIFIGHDHTNNYAFEHEGVILGYGLKTGKTSYFDEDLQGGLKITLTENMTKINLEHIFENWG